MAYVRKAKNGWRVEVQRAGVRRSATFPLKSTATAWAVQQENEILAGKAGSFPVRTVSQALRRYELEVSSGKRGGRAESLRFAAFERDHPALAAKVISEVKVTDLAAWRDARLRKVSKGSVQREVNLLRNVWTVAEREWLWCGASPWRGLRMPGDNPPRSQRVRWQEVKRIVRWLGYVSGKPPTTKYQEVAWAMMIALRTAMRAGEIMSLERGSVDLAAGVVRLATHKTLEKVGARSVPLTKHGVRLLTVLCSREGPLWNIGTASLDALFRKARDHLMLQHLHFHDTRAEALTLLARRGIDVMTLARISGHRDLRTLMDAYYRETAAQIAARL